MCFLYGLINFVHFCLYGLFLYFIFMQTNYSAKEEHTKFTTRGREGIRKSEKGMQGWNFGIRTGNFIFS